MNSVPMACLLLAVSPATGQWMKEERFKASGCAAADLVKVSYVWSYCMKVSDTMYMKDDCGVTTSTNFTRAYFTDSACTTAVTQGGTPHRDQEILACHQNNGDDYYTTYTCGAAPSSHADTTIWTDSSCTTASYSMKYAIGMCSRDFDSSGSGNATTWTPKSSMSVFEGTASNSTGLVTKNYGTADCSGATTSSSTMGVTCTDNGGTYLTITAADGVANVANSIGKLSPLIWFFCTAAMLKCF